MYKLYTVKFNLRSSRGNEWLICAKSADEAVRIAEEAILYSEEPFEAKEVNLDYRQKIIRFIPGAPNV